MVCRNGAHRCDSRQNTLRAAAESKKAVRHGRSNGYFVFRGHHIRIDFYRYIVACISNKGMIEEHIVIVNFKFVYQFLTQFLYKMFPVHDAVGAQCRYKPYVFFGHACLQQFPDDRLCRGFTGRGSCHIIYDNHRTFLSFCTFANRRRPDGGMNFIRNFLLRKLWGPIPCKFRNMHFPVFRKVNDNGPIAIHVIGR